MIRVINSTENPIQLMGRVAGVCYGSKDTQDANYKRGLKCVKDNHGRVMEFPDVIVSIDEYSARCIRQIYTAMVGVSKLSASTRYISYDNFNYYTPECMEDNHNYHALMNTICDMYNQLVEQGYDKEDVANILPLGMTQTMVLKINYRAMLHLAEIRLCERAYKEIRDFTKELIEAVSEIDTEWCQLMTYMKPKCKTCTEKASCPRLKGESDGK